MYGKTAEQVRTKINELQVKSPRDAMEILGHSRISVTMEIYTHGDEESRESAIRKVNDLFE
ncbi:hypothetical protein [Sphaerisporangium flaviroseum]|uniref:hypothetical protein n=1 Tax=Sphaerisporangium flaviroseum TaxID=509199 RepID=UPI0031F1C1E1